ncbi:MAG TPA: Smr/MutS family protein [Terriglobales bacterium]|nr:Smr/MutS family protein [Terriglobales bacterium]
MSSNIPIVNLEEGFPTRDEALRRLEAALARARQHKIRVLKIIHGYGSSGVGGILRPVVRNFLRQAKERGEIKLFVNGEGFSRFDSRSKKLIGRAAELLLDRDLGRGNRGVTFVLL